MYIDSVLKPIGSAKKVPNTYFNVFGILGRATIKFRKNMAFFMDTLKTFKHCYRNIIIIRSFIYCIYQRLRANFESYLIP